MGVVEIRLLGRFAVRIDGADVPYQRFGGRLTRTLVALLAVRRGTLLSRDVLVEALWGDRPPSDPPGNLDVLASRARRALGAHSLVEAVSGGLLLAGDDRIEVDVERFASAVARGRTYLAAERPASALRAFDEALTAWGDPLPEHAYSDWAEPFRHEFADLRLEALEGGARSAIALGNVPAATRLAEAAVEHNPLRELGNLLLVSALAQGGDQVGALEAFDAFRRRLRDELGLDPSAEAYEVQSKVLRGVRQSAVGVLAEMLPEARAVDPRAALGGQGSGPMRARTLASLAMFAAGSDDYERAAGLVDLALTDAGRDARAKAEALYVGSIVDMNLGDLGRADRRADEALCLFEELEDADGVANILDGRAMALFMSGHVSDAVAAFDRVANLFAEAGELARVVTPRSTRGHGLVFMAEPAGGLAEAERALDLAVSLGEREGEGYALWHRSEALAALGRSDDAVRGARASLAIAEELQHREWTAAALRALALASRAAGDLSAAEEAYRHGLTVSAGIPLFQTWHAAGLASVLLTAGRVEEARHWVEVATGGNPPLGLFEARLAAVRLAVATGSPSADSLAEDLRRHASAVGYEAIVGQLPLPGAERAGVGL